MPITLLPSLLLAIILVGFTPGPANLFSLHCSMKNGTKKAMTMWFGLLTGFTVAATLGAVVTHLVGAMMDKYVVWLKYLTYFIWHGKSTTAKAKQKQVTILVHFSREWSYNSPTQKLSSLTSWHTQHSCYPIQTIYPTCSL